MASLSFEVEVDLSSFRLILMAQQFVSQQIAGLPEGRVPSADLLELHSGLAACIEKFNAKHVGAEPSKEPFFGEVGMAVDDLAAMTIEVAAAEASSQLPTTPHFADSLRKAATIFAFIRGRADAAIHALAMAGFEPGEIARPQPQTAAGPTRTFVGNEFSNREVTGTNLDVRA